MLAHSILNGLCQSAQLMVDMSKIVHSSEINSAALAEFMGLLYWSMSLLLLECALISCYVLCHCLNYMHLAVYLVLMYSFFKCV